MVPSCYLGENDAQLIRVGGAIPSMATDLWILAHPDLRKTERIRIFWFMSQDLQRVALRSGGIGRRGLSAREVDT